MKSCYFTPSYRRALITQTYLLKQGIFNALVAYIKLQGVFGNNLNSPNSQQFCCLEAEY
jgi:hypothetical protein